jgi:hypothetical protein
MIYIDREFFNPEIPGLGQDNPRILGYALDLVELLMQQVDLERVSIKNKNNIYIFVPSVYNRLRLLPVVCMEHARRRVHLLFFGALDAVSVKTLYVMQEVQLPYRRSAGKRIS